MLRIVSGLMALALCACAHQGADSPSVTCAEPSRDQIETDLAVAESASEIGLRAPTIQLLRDAMYRLCEARTNDAIDEEEYRVMLDRYQQALAKLMAIEQLANAPDSPAIEAKARPAS